MATKILFFDDEKGIAEILQKNLELFNYDVKLVSTISELFAEINNTNITYNLMLMDIMAPMPNSNEKNMFSSLELSNMDNGIRIGEIFVDKIRCIGKYSNVPILFYSAKGSVKSYPNTKFLPKPALAKDIVEEIKTLLGGGTK